MVLRNENLCKTLNCIILYTKANMIRSFVHIHRRSRYSQCLTDGIHHQLALTYCSVTYVHTSDSVLEKTVHVYSFACENKGYGLQKRTLK